MYEDILDGYFPLRVSISDLMQRRGVRNAVLRMSFAPILEVAGLPHDAPVPLNIRSARVGMILRAELLVSMGPQGAELAGVARWYWLDGTSPHTSLDIMTRLAEPALVQWRSLPERTFAVPGIQLERACEGSA